MGQPLKFNKEASDAPFNMAQLFYYRLNELMAHKTKAKLYGNLEDWFNALVEIHTQISFKLNKEENKNNNEQLQKIRGYLYSPLPTNKRAARQMKSLINGRARGWLLDFDRSIMGQMDRHKMIFPRIDVRTPMATMREDMGLKPQ